MSLFGSLRNAGSLPVEGHLPGFGGATGWLNSEPLTAADLRGKVVLTDFWTYTCINWLRTLAYVRAWADRYAEQGLVVVGVHTPEFPFERDEDNVRRAARDLRVTYPIALDADYAIWQAFANRYWPAVYIADAQGRIRHHHFGEGGYAECEMVDPAPAARGRTRGRGRRPRRRRRRGVRGAGRLGQPGVARDLPRLRAGPQLRLAGPSRARRASRLRRRPTRSSSTAGRSRATGRSSGARAVSSEPEARSRSASTRATSTSCWGRAREEPPSRSGCCVDGEPPGAAHGLDTDEAGNGVLVEQRLHQLIRQPGAIADRTFEIAFLDAGAEAYVFTFG